MIALALLAQLLYQPSVESPIFAPQAPLESVQPGSGSRSPFINVRAAPYFAVGDGVADDSTAVTNAVAAAGAAGFNGVLLPCPGSYKTSTWGTLSCGMQFIQAGTGATPRPQSGKERDQVSIWDYGCKGDGATDDTVCLQNAITQANATQGEIVLTPLPTGAAQFRFTTALTSKQDISFRGVGPKFGVQLVPDGCQAFKIRGVDQVGGVAFRFYMENLTIAPINTPANTKLIEINTAYSIHFEHVWMFNVADNGSIGWDVTDASDVVFDRVVAYGAGNTTSKGVVTHSTGGARFTSIDVTRPDFENFNHAFENNDGAVMTILDPYMERNIVGVDNNATTAGRATIVGGAIHGTNSSTICVRTLGTNTFLHGTLLNPGSDVHRFSTAIGSRVFYHDTSTNTFYVGNSNVAGDLVPATNWVNAGGLQSTNFYHGRATPAYSATIAIDALTADEFVITPTNGTAFTVSTPINPNGNQRITVRIKNTFGVLGAITMGAGFKFAGAPTFPVVANGFNRSIDFVFDGGSNWVEVSRTPADVPN